MRQLEVAPFGLDSSLCNNPRVLVFLTRFLWNLFGNSGIASRYNKLRWARLCRQNQGPIRDRCRPAKQATACERHISGARSRCNPLPSRLGWAGFASETGTNRIWVRPRSATAGTYRRPLAAASLPSLTRVSLAKPSLHPGFMFAPASRLKTSEPSEHKRDS